MNKINNDGLHEYTFEEACNKFLSDVSPINGVAYPVNYNKYTAKEAFAIIKEQTDLHSHELVEIINALPHYGAHEYTATEALNKEGSILADGNYKSLNAVNWTDVGDVNWSDWDEQLDS